jgi:HEAT repeat protein
MSYDEYNTCITILQKKTGWFAKDDLKAKLECLETFRLKGTPSDIHGILPFLRDDNEAISLRTAEVIASLSDKIKSLNQLYDSLKYLSISISDVDFYIARFRTDLAIKLLGIASLNHNGYVRQKTVEALGQIDEPTVIRYLIVRLGDWVSNVRGAATSAIKNFFIDKYRESFITELLSIELFKQISRVDLSPQYELIIDYLLKKRLTKDYYNSLKVVTDKARLLYVKKYIERHGIDKELISIMVSDQNFLIRSQVLQYARHLDRAEQSELILRLLNDNSSQVRLSSLYYIKAEASSYYEVILNLASDLSASVRDLARYLCALTSWTSGIYTESELRVEPPK